MAFSRGTKGRVVYGVVIVWLLDGVVMICGVAFLNWKDDLVWVALFTEVVIVFGYVWVMFRKS